MIIKPPGRTHTVKWIRLGLNAAMALAYAGLGLFLFFSPAASTILSAEYRTPVALALILYGVFRGFRAWFQYKNNRIL